MTEKTPTIYEQLKDVLQHSQDILLSPSDVKTLVIKKYGTNSDSIILSDYCYNRFNAGISFTQHLFQYVNRGTYKYLGEKYPYTGLIFRKPKQADHEIIVGEWKHGEKTLHGGDQTDTLSEIKYLYEQYNEILHYELQVLNCKPTELRHLIGRIGEFFCAIEINGCLARNTNQHGFDVIANGRKISVKTTAQTSGFISVNMRTFAAFDDFFVVQYVNDAFKLLYHGPKENLLKISRTYDEKYEIDINRLAKLSSKV